jgi:hypothetical protein
LEAPVPDILSAVLRQAAAKVREIGYLIVPSADGGARVDAEPLAATLDQVAASAERGEQVGSVNVEAYYRHPLTLARLILEAAGEEAGHG